MARDTSKIVLAVFVLAVLGCLGSFLSLCVLYYHPGLRGTPHQRLGLSAVAMAILCWEFVFLSASGRTRILPSTDKSKKALFRRIQVYVLCIFSGYCLALEDPWLLGFVGLGALAVFGYFMISGRFWRRRLILFLATLLAAPPAISFFVSGLGHVKIDPGGQMNMWPVALLIAVLWLFSGSDES